MKYLLSLLILILGECIFSQNLLPDPGFEIWNGVSGGSMNPLYNWNAAAGTPDHHHQSNPTWNSATCANSAIPLTNSTNIGAGTVHAGLGCLGVAKYVNGPVEWASTLLTSPLEKDSCYKVSFYIQNKKNLIANPSAINNWGVYFGFNATTPNPQFISYGNSSSQWVSWPQVINDTVWHYVEMYIQPDTSYTYLNIGFVGDWSNTVSINANNQSLYVWIDDVSVQKISGCCPSNILQVVTTNGNCWNAGSIVVTSTSTSATYILINAYTGATVATNSTGNFTGLSSGQYYVKVNDGVCSKVTGTCKLINLGVHLYAGEDATTTVCGNGQPIDLFNLLIGTAMQGGTWAPALSSGTNFFNPSIDPAGVYTYILADSCGSDSSSVTVNVIPPPTTTVHITPDGSFCLGDSPAILTVNIPNGTWFGPGINAITGSFNIPALSVGSFEIVYVAPGLCADTDTLLFYINQSGSQSIAYADSSYCNTGFSDIPTITGTTSGGYFTINPPAGVIDSLTGVINLSATPAGNYDVIFIPTDPCTPMDTAAIQIIEQAYVNVAAAGPFCVNESPQFLLSNGAGGVWSGPGVNSTTGIFQPSVAGVGTWQIINQVVGLCGDSDTILISVLPLENPSFSYASTAYCNTGFSDIPFVSGTAGGTFTLTPAGSINPLTGMINLNATPIGNYWVNYSTNGICPQVDSIALQILEQLSINISPAGPYCFSDNAQQLIANLPSGLWSGAGVIATTGIFTPSLAGTGTWPIVYTISGLCGDSDTLLVTVLADDNPSFSYAAANYCNTGFSDIPVINGTTGGTFSMSPTGNIDPVSGEIDLISSPVGMYTVNYATNGVCPMNASFAIQNIEQISVNISPAGPFCLDDLSQAIIPTISGGFWTGMGINSSTGIFNPSSAGDGTWQIIYAIPGLCGDSDTTAIVVYPLPSAFAGSDQTIQKDSSTAISATGGLFYSWIPSTGLTCDSCATTNAQPIETTVYTVTVTDTNECIASDNLRITVKNLWDNLYIPNSFTPNGDEDNNAFRTVGLTVQFFHMEIYDRWGTLLFATDDINSYWDGTFAGKICPQGSYSYKVEYGYNLNKSEIIRLAGHVILLY
ncbi:MAG: T9SS type B sorting domain-containing protein [Crocinitomicaceae bacterium]